MENVKESLLMEIRMNRRELEVEHRIFMAVKKAKEDGYDYAEKVIEFLTEDKK
jgi:UDP-N-acetylmuramyl pentapeptide synthase